MESRLDGSLAQAGLGGDLRDCQIAPEAHGYDHLFIRSKPPKRVAHLVAKCLGIVWA